MQSSQFYTILKQKSHADSDWQISYYQGFKEYIFDPDLNEEIAAMIKFVEVKNYHHSFRFNVELKSIQFLLGVFPDSKEIFVATKQLGHELTLSRMTHQNPVIEEMTQLASKIAMIPIENTPAVVDIITSRYQLSDFSDEKFKQIHFETEKLSKELVKKVNIYQQSLFERFSDYGLGLTANFMLIRIHLLKFLAILPSLDHDKTGQEVKRILLESIQRLLADSQIAETKKLKGQQRAIPPQVILGAKIVFKLANILPSRLLASMIRKAVGLMAKRFIAGENINSAQKSLRQLLDTNRDATLDQLGELVVSNKEADEYVSKVLEIIHGLSQHIIPGSKNKAGINQAHVSIKVSALSNDFRPYAYEQTYAKVAPRLKNILLAAKEHQVFINIDAEHYHYRDIVLKIYSEVLLSTPELSDYAQTGIVVQAYLRDGHKHFNDVLNLAKKRNMRMPIRLVKGAYWDVETVEATAHNFDAPEFLNKEETDVHYRQIICLALQNAEFIQLTVASHNIQDHCFAEVVRSKMYPEAAVIEHQCLHMTYEALSMGLSLMNWPVRNYIPIGNLLVGMAYLVRRIMENSSQVGVLTIMRSHKKSMNFVHPKELLDDKFRKKLIVHDESIATLSGEFKNIYPIRTYIPKSLNSLNEQMTKLSNNLNEGQLIYQTGDTSVVASSRPSLILGKIHADEPKEVNQKIENLFQGFIKNNWKEDASERSIKLLMLADLLLIHREELTSIIVYEAGKTLSEAIADVDEAIDFIQFYVKEYQTIMSKIPDYQPKGVFGVIAPWNFPLAIPVGMTTAALACGNTVLLKPAEQTPLIALKFIELARLCNLDSSILDITLGEAHVGKAIVDHELISGVVFTGSKQVGVEIYLKLKKTLTSTRYPFPPINKTVITEMGGKNAIIITNNCELDETVSGVIYSAFAHAGQKCSAASRIIIDREIKDSFIARFVEAVKDLKVGESSEYDTVINPLISEMDQKRVREAVAMAVKEAQANGGRIHLDDSRKKYPGFCVGPSIIELDSQTALKAESIAQKELFGPVLHIIPYDNLEEAVYIFNSTDYALTGGVYGQSQNDIDYLIPKMKAGNIYVNRPNTGARVAIEPFGGFKMSGTGPKAGGVDYLYSFMRLNKEVHLSSEKLYISDHSPIHKFLPANASKLSWRNRIEKLSAFLDEIMSNYEVYFQQINEEEKEIIKDLAHYIKRPEHNFKSKKYKNRRVPGQISYSKKDLTLKTGAFIFSNEHISLASFVEVIFNLYLGNGINIYCTLEATYKRWAKILKLMYRHGISAYNISCNGVTKKELIEYITQNEYQFVVYDYNPLIIKEVNSQLFKTAEHYLIKTYISDIDLPLKHWKRYIDAFTITRSFAINTMRHGAPLEVDLH